MMKTSPNKDAFILTLLTQLTIYGICLTIIMAMVNHRITSQTVIIVCCYLASVFIWNLLVPVAKLTRQYVGQVICVIMICIFGWWLMHTAENTRAGWYRFNVLQQRIHSIVQTAPAYIILSDCRGKITCTSNNIETLTGFKPTELIDQSIFLLMRNKVIAKHQVAFSELVRILRSDSLPNQSWGLCGEPIMAVRHKNGYLIPVRLYTGGIRWSTDIQFPEDMDIFAIMQPVKREDVTHDSSTLTDESFQEAPPASAIKKMH